MKQSKHLFTKSIMVALGLFSAVGAFAGIPVTADGPSTVVVAQDAAFLGVSGDAAQMIFDNMVKPQIIDNDTDTLKLLSPNIICDQNKSNSHVECTITLDGLSHP
jgi:hypothetical protein